MVKTKLTQRDKILLYLGMAIILFTHLWMLVSPLPSNQNTIHAVGNIIAFVLIGFNINKAGILNR